MNDLQPGIMEFNIESNPPNFSKLNLNDILGNIYNLFYRIICNIDMYKFLRTIIF